MRVLYVNQTAEVSGAERSLLALIDGLGDRSSRWSACPPEHAGASSPSDRGIEPLPILGTAASFRLHPLHTSRGLAEIGRSALQVRRLARRQRADLVHANTTRAALLALLARARAAAARARPHPRLGAGGAVLPRRARRRRPPSRRVVANSAYIAGQFDGLPLRRPGSRSSTTRSTSAASTRRGRPRRRAARARASPTGAVALAVVAQLTPWKGQDDAIRILAELRRRGTLTRSC